MADLIIRGGTVVSAAGRQTADIAVESGRIVAFAPQLPADAEAREVDASGLLVLPGVVDVHTHTRVASDEHPDRFFQDSVAAAFGGTTTFLAFNNPGTGSEQTGSLPTDANAWRRQTDSDSAIDYGLNLVLQPAHADKLPTEIPQVVDMGVPTFKAFMVYDFGLSSAAIAVALRAAARSHGMLMVHGEDRAALEANIARLKAQGKTQPRFHAESRPPYVEAAGTRMAIDMARNEDAPLYLVHLSSQAALAEIVAGREVGGRVFVETCPHFLVLDESRYELPDADCARFIISPPLRSPADRAALWAALADGTLNVVSTDHVPDTVAEKRGWDVCFDQISNGAPGIETLLALVYSEGVQRGHITVERMVDVLSTTPARLFGMPHKGAIEVNRDADIVLFDPQERRTVTQAELHHTSDYTPYEGRAASGIVRSTIVRGEFVVRDGHFVGRRGHGQFQERTLQ
ncbi:MAG: dihydropyrimidinase [Chloroflexota bacterium]|nr:dihydropyrimidinase [Chloroflexota bacterium]